jgi:hypothetical protein
VIQDLITLPSTEKVAPHEAAATSSWAASPVTPSASATLEEEEEEVAPTQSSYQILFFLIVFVGASGGLFVWLGGMRWARRVLGMQESVKYRKVDDEDLEK